MCWFVTSGKRKAAVNATVKLLETIDDNDGDGGCDDQGEGDVDFHSELVVE